MSSSGRLIVRRCYQKHSGGSSVPSQAGDMFGEEIVVEHVLQVSAGSRRVSSRVRGGLLQSVSCKAG